MAYYNIFCKKEDHRSYRRNFCSREKKAWKKLGLHRIRILDFCDTGAALYQLSKEANWEQVVELNWFVIDPWKDDDEVLNIWKSYTWTSGWRVIGKFFQAAFSQLQNLRL